MKLRLFVISLSFGFITALAAQPPATPPSASAAPAPVSGAMADLESLVGRINAKLEQGKTTVADLTAELAAFDALAAKYKNEKTEDSARILYMQAGLYVQVLQDTDKALEILRRLKTDFATTEIGAGADRMIASLEAQGNAAKTQAALIGKPAPELTIKWSNQDGLKKLSDLKGKVVVLDFWATWCGPCVASFPDVRELAAHYKNSDVAILGVTSLQGTVMGLSAQPIDTKDDPAKEFALMSDYIKAKEITWTIAFSEQEVFNPDYGIQGIPHIAIVAPDGTVRHTGLHPSMPKEEKYGKIDAILKEFGKKVPAASESKK